MLQIMICCHRSVKRGCIYHPEVLPVQLVPKKVGSAFGLLCGMFAAAIVLQRHLKNRHCF
jgi:hypothetical protein